MVGVSRQKEASAVEGCASQLRSAAGERGGKSRPKQLARHHRKFAAMPTAPGSSMVSDALAPGREGPTTSASLDQPSPPAHDSPADPYTTQLRLILQPWIVHFKSPGYIKHDMMAMLQDMCKKTLRRTIKEPDVRKSIGSSEILWRDLCELLENAVPSLEQRSFAPADPQAPEFEGASGTLIAANYSTLMKDLERLNDLVSIARNVLTTGEVAQDLAAKAHFDQEIFKLISVCVKVTARGFDGDAGTADEQRWQEVVNSYKKLLITCLQFLNNLVARNERRKLMLWVELFDSSRDSNLPPAEELASLSLASTPKSSGAFGEDFALGSGTQQPASSPFLLYIGKVGMEVKRELVARGEKSGATEIAAECKKRWQEMPQEARDVCAFSFFSRFVIDCYGFAGNNLGTGMAHPLQRPDRQVPPRCKSSQISEAAART